MKKLALAILIGLYGVSTSAFATDTATAPKSTDAAATTAPTEHSEHDGHDHSATAPTATEGEKTAKKPATKKSAKKPH